ncbi:MinD/ParA family protein [Paenibacillus rhizovicinus]|uniref:MinD/ParA family protein n=1 Tax=Paenibacillus rhizovicinus TaxID=2704463 RepID=A0A6C0NV23_9BACL|nr:MinD/ParA family protein [Paenibacillus rhizovicinus]QHW30049.1 MinD/ParA family protein [Paenibacillus rhizovicinus]
MNDQAEALRHMVRNQEMSDAGRMTRIITVTSGKGGVGKSNFSLNFAIALSRLGKKVLVFDADISMANIDVLMGISSTYNLYHLLKQEKTIWEIIQEGSQGVHFIAGGSGFKDLLDLSPSQLDFFAQQIGRLQGQYDIIIFDTGAGLSKETVKFIAAAQETIVVTTPEPTSITDAYALIKMVTAMENGVNFKLIVNRAVDEREGKATADKIGLVARRFLELDIPVLGILPDDPNVSKAVKKQVPFGIAFPGTDASKAINEIAYRFAEVPGSPASANSGVKGFLQRMFKRS